MILASLSRAKALRISLTERFKLPALLVISISVLNLSLDTDTPSAPGAKPLPKFSTENKGVGRKFVYMSLPAFLYLIVNQS